LTAAAGQLRAFALDDATHVRLLLAAPLLALSESIVARELARAIAHFDEARLIAEPGRPRFSAAAERFARVAGNRMTLAALIVLAYAVSLEAVWNLWPRDIASWAFAPSPARLSGAGWWLALVALPAFQLLLLRALFRLASWAVFVVRVSRLPLELLSTHPDGHGGLLFLGNATVAFRAAVLAVSAVVTAALERRVRLEGMPIRAAGTQLAGLAVVVVLSLFGPLVAFTPSLWRLRVRGMYQLGVLGDRYARGFAARWFTTPEAQQGELLGTPDIQSLADLGNAHERTSGTGLLPCSTRNLIEVAAALLLPLLPVALIEPAMADALKKVVRALL
jgi:hypothetical protein